MSKIKARFDRFNQANPQFYQLFTRYALQLIAAGHGRLSSKMIVERIRFELMVQKEPLSINNSYTPYLARKFMADFPNHDGVFETRETAA